MAPLRRVLRRVAVIWLLCLAASSTLAPVVFSFSAAEELLECRCTHGDHAVCPMHHKPTPTSETCLMTGTADRGIAVFSWLLSVGLVPPPTELLLPQRRVISLPIDFTTASLRPAAPDPPPPRA